jgi:type III restriction enzyme
MTTKLKVYQEESLAELSAFLAAARETDAERAFNALRRPSGSYKEIPGWRESKAFPYVCIRIPTGGGKTLLAAHSVGRVCRDYLHAERRVVLWLAPSDAIVQQTLRQLRDRGHPVHKALAEDFGGQVEVLDIRQALYVTPATLSGAVTVIVSTAQSWRVEGKEGRKVYQPDNGALMGHFSGVDTSLLAKLEQSEGGRPVYSLANVLRLRKPIVIIDEGHRFRTKLTFETLKRFSPCAVVEFTATPYVEGKDRVASNVLVERSAADLRDEHMIKAPIILKESKQWPDAVRLAVEKRTALQRACEAEEKSGGRYIRPIVLFKAEDTYKDRQSVSVDVLRDYLIKEKYAKPDEVVIHVGDRKDLPDNILSPACPVNFVITVDALGEGWDCPFAYVLCTVATLSSSVAVEQILGRVLRMPYVTLKRDEALNHAYCFTSSGEFGEAAGNLKDALVDAGFSRDEAENAVQEAPPERGSDDEPAPLFRGREVPVFIDRRLTAQEESALAKVVPGDVRFERAAEGSATVALYKGDMLTPVQVSEVAKVLNTPQDPKAGERFRRAAAGEDASPSGLGSPFKVPGLAIADPHAEGGYSLFDSQHRETPWTLAKCPHELDSGAFDASPPRTRTFELTPDAEGAWVDHYKGELAETVLAQDQAGPRSLASLSAWLDREIEETRVTQDDKRAFIDRALVYLTTARGLSVEMLSPVRWRLAERLRERIDHYRIGIERTQYQTMITGMVEVLKNPHPSVVFPIDVHRADYPGMRASTDNRAFPRHYFPRVGEMNGDERLCAQQIDAHPNTKHWVRNLDRAPGAFWLPGFRQRFFPDFIVELRDGRYAAVEFKMTKMELDPEEDAKRTSGTLWAGRSGGKCVFLWVVKETIEETLKAGLAPIV